MSRDPQYDGTFVFAVQSTGVFCRPSCPSRRPRRENVQFFRSPAEAQQAGFRACRRCQPDRAAPAEPNLELVQRMCSYLAEPRERLPTLQELAGAFHLSPFHLQRTFKRLVGLTPRQYAAAQRRERFRASLHNGETVTAAVYEAGYPSSSSVYDSPAERFGVSPRQYREGSQAVAIAYAITPCPLGWLLVAASGQGICSVKLADSEAELEALLRAEFPAADLRPDDGRLRDWVAALLGYLEGDLPHLDLPLDVRATAFQQRVWDALRAIPRGSTRSYGDVARAIGRPTAARAVAQACAANPVALVIPCHRVVREDGDVGGYRWGAERKRKLLDQESH